MLTQKNYEQIKFAIASENQDNLQFADVKALLQAFEETYRALDSVLSRGVPIAQEAFDLIADVEGNPLLVVEPPPPAYIPDSEPG